MDATAVESWSLAVSAVGSLGTIVALAVAVFLGIRESRAVRQENATRDDERHVVEVERRAAEERRRRSQAECISAQLHINLGRPYARDQNELGYSSYVQIVNSSSLPIYDAVITLDPDNDGNLKSAKAGFVPGGQESHKHSPAYPDRSQDGTPVEVSFRDAAGIRWHRLTDGDLHECENGT